MVAKGDIIGSYELISELGVGGGGAVYEARHVLLGRSVAIKIMNEDFIHDTQLISRFFHEARIVNAIRHPNIIDIVDFLDLHEPRRVAYVMELLEGRPLTKVAHDGGVTAKQAANACLQIASVLKAAHEKRVIHRDLKPDNVFVLHTRDEDWARVPSIKVLDFGVAKLDSAEVSHRTETGVAVGTPVYMAPEQLVAAPVSPATDVYALGEILYEILAGRRLFTGSHTEILTQKISGAPTAPMVFPQLADPAPIIALIKKCIALSAEERPSLAEVVEVLNAMAKGEVPRFAYTPAPPLSPAPTAAITPPGAPPDPISLMPPYAPIEPPPTVAQRAAPAPRPTSVDRASPPPPRPAPPKPAPDPATRVRNASLATAPDRPAPVVSGALVEAPPARSKLPFVIAGASVIVIGLAIGALLRPSAEVPSSRPLTAPPATPLASAPPPPAQPVDLFARVTSDPAGAVVVDDATGENLGTTPSRVVLREGRPRAVRVSLAGYRSFTGQLDRDRLDLNVALSRGDDPVRKPTPKPSASAAATPKPNLDDAAAWPSPPPLEASPKPSPAKPLRKDETTEW